jgi:hypothetical protein
VKIILYLHKIYENRWFRLVSFPGPKLYPVNKKDWELLLEKQNMIISDILEGSTLLYGVTGEYSTEGYSEDPVSTDSSAFAGFVFSPLDPISMHKISPDEFKMDEIYQGFITELKWEPNKYNELLKALANDDARMFFISPERKCLIAPYYGGIDFVLENTAVRDYYKKKYRDKLADVY